ncbi:hypothetical protein FHS95_000907 [Sphingomonas naasensis]|nr:hypothetical protein [Sphingomonas naasensis]
MSEGSGGPWTSSGAHVSAPPHEVGRSENVEPARPEGRLPAFPAERAERGIQLVSRLAGPAVFVLALGGIAWWLIK